MAGTRTQAHTYPAKALIKPCGLVRINTRPKSAALLLD